MVLKTNFSKDVILLFSFAADDTVKNTTGCHNDFLFLLCGGGLVINIIYGEFGVSTSDCDAGRACCPSTGDCIVPADEERLEAIRVQCQGREFCSVQAINVGWPCGIDVPVAGSDYENIYYSCVEGEILLWNPTS